MTIKEALQTGIEKLTSSGSPELDTEILLAHTLESTREHLLAHPEQELSDTEEVAFLKVIKKREKGTPISYITGEKEFFGDTFLVTTDVLIPRPETETIIEFTLSKTLKAFGKDPQINVVDIGTGSGAIAITLAKALHASHVTALDVSEKALDVVYTNLQIHPEAQNINLMQSDILSRFPAQKLDLVVANLPYLSEEVYRNEPSIQFEPKLALVAKDGGMFFYKQLFAQLTSFVHKDTLLSIEIDPHQYDVLKNDLLSHFPKAEIEPILSEDKTCKLGLFAKLNHIDKIEDSG